MAERLCDPFPVCGELDGQLLIHRTLEGPPLGRTDADFGLQEARLAGCVAVPYLRLRFKQTWKAKEACRGLVRSILGLAPGEEITFDTRTAVQVDFATAITNSQEYSATYDNSNRVTTEDTETSSTAQSRSSTDTDTVDLGPIGTWGCGGDATVQTIEEITERTQSTIRDILTSVSITQTSGRTVEVTSSSQVLTENSITRRVRNPYSDRSLELRFSPVFRRFEVTTEFEAFAFGLTLKPGSIRFSPRVSVQYGDFLEHTLKDRSLVNASVLQASTATRRTSRASVAANPVLDHLSANAAFYTARFLSHVQREGGRQPIREISQQALGRMKTVALPDGPGVESGLAMDRLRVIGDRIIIPARSPEEFRGALALPNWQSTLLQKLSGKEFLDPFKLKFTFTRDVHLFMGTHVEPVAGECVLQNLPTSGGG